MSMTDSVAETPVLAIVEGKPLTEMPADLFIPPDALEVLLESFTGPLDLLLYLIRRQNLDIMNIPIAHITRQYLQYIQLMEDKRLELAAEYLLMAAMLAEIKSRLLLPVIATEDEEVEDPRMALVRQLQLYEQFKNAAENLDKIPRCERDVSPIRLEIQGQDTIKLHPEVTLLSIIEAMQALITQQGHEVHHYIEREPLSVRERMTRVLQALEQQPHLAFSSLFTLEEGRMGLAVSLLAILELARQALLRIIQPNVFAPIYLQANQDG